MADRRIYGCAETGTYQTEAPTPHVDLTGTAATGYAIRQLFSSALSNGDTCTVTLRADADNWAVYGGAVFTTGSPNSLDLSSATLLDSAGTLTDNASVQVLGLEPDASQFPALYAPTISANALVLDLHGERDTYHRVTLNANIGAGGITVSNVPTGGVVRILVEMHQSGGPYSCPIEAWTGIPGLVFDWPYQLYTDATPTIFSIFSTDGMANSRASSNAEVVGNTVLAVTELPASPDADTVYLVYGA
jgi:hypothetical protein